MMKFYNVGASGNAYKVRILLALLRVPHEVVLLDLAKREHKTPEFLRLNPRGEVPVIEDAGAVVWDSGACLVYLARKHGGERWLPTAPAPMAEVMQWLSLAASEIQFGLQYARRGLMQKRWTAGTLEQNHAIARVALTAIEQRLKKNEWLALDRATIADVACFSYVESAPESGIPLDAYPNISAWLERCMALPDWPAR
jgi:glutathione S-transferase